MKMIWLRAYCNQNLGDDLFIQIICNRYPDTQFFMASETENPFYQSIKNLKVLRFGTEQKIQRKLHLLPFAKEMKKCDGIVVIGGSMFMESYNGLHKLDEYMTMRKHAEKMFILGSNFGPYQTDEYYQKAKKMFSSMDGVCFRDSYSYALFSDVNNVRMASDIAFLSEEQLVEKEEHSVCFAIANIKRRDELKSYDESYKKWMRKQILSFLEHDWKVKVLCFCPNQQDDACAKDILEGIEDQVRCISYEGNMNHMLKEIAQSEMMVSTRFHGLILGLRYQCKVFPVIYDEKIKNVLDDLHAEYNYPAVSQLENVSFEDIMNNCVSTNTEYNRQAEKQFADLDQWLKI